eukprot:3486171-Pyramimonas_sp.AAC.1
MLESGPDRKVHHAGGGVLAPPLLTTAGGGGAVSGAVARCRLQLRRAEPPCRQLLKLRQATQSDRRM